MQGGRLFEAVSFGHSDEVQDEYGGISRAWVTMFETRAEFIYNRGTEAVQAGNLQGTATFKVKVRSSIQSRALTTDSRMRDIRRGVEYQIREVDAISDRKMVYLVVESGVAV